MSQKFLRRARFKKSLGCSSNMLASGLPIPSSILSRCVVIDHHFYGKERHLLLHFGEKYRLYPVFDQLQHAITFYKLQHHSFIWFELNVNGYKYRFFANTVPRHDKRIHLLCQSRLLVAWPADPWLFFSQSGSTFSLPFSLCSSSGCLCAAIGLGLHFPSKSVLAWS